MAGAFTPLHPTARKYADRTHREPLPARLRELVERLHEAEPIRNPRERREKERRATEKNCTHARN
jgi:hypothetical protein